MTKKKVGGWVKWVGTHKVSGLRGLTVCPEGGDPTVYEVEEVGSGWNLYKDTYTCYRLRRKNGKLACNCPDAVKRSREFVCKHVVGLTAALHEANIEPF